MIAYINAAAMEAIAMQIHSPSRHIFAVVEDIASKRNLDANTVLQQVAKIDLRYKAIIELGTIKTK